MMLFHSSPEVLVISGNFWSFPLQGYLMVPLAIGYPSEENDYGYIKCYRAMVYSWLGSVIVGLQPGCTIATVSNGLGL